MTIGEILHKRRKELNLSYRQLSNITGISHSHISSIEKGIEPKTKKPVRPSYEVIEKLARGLNVTIDYLLGKVDNPNHVYIEPTLLGNGKGTSMPKENHNEFNKVIVTAYKKMSDDVIAHAETMDLTSKQQTAIDEFKKMPLTEKQQELLEVFEKLKNLPPADREVLIKIIKSYQ